MFAEFRQFVPILIYQKHRRYSQNCQLKFVRLFATNEVFAIPGQAVGCAREKENSPI
jgi:hypothetical protein